ncbi:BLUF domain-containing protein [Phenylobacterium sp.]|jgi:hypothetical protein|uniref:BLUF domain-containing protein n=1 Tax=Phenylobacterium sp. TaxID=1871053 RepID=UPI002F3E6717
MTQFQNGSRARAVHRLIYASRQRFAANEPAAQALEAIAASAARHNAAAGVTGLLLAHGGWLLQVLEGPANAVMTTYRRILDDPRHDEPRVIISGPVREREFEEAGMDARRMNPAGDCILGALDQRTAFTPRELSDVSALALLKAVRGCDAPALVALAG